MSKTVSFKNNDRFIQIGIAIVTLRKLRGMSQEKLAEKAGISRSLLSVIEAPGTAHNFTLDVFLLLIHVIICLVIGIGNNAFSMHALVMRYAIPVLRFLYFWLFIVPVSWLLC